MFLALAVVSSGCRQRERFALQVVELAGTTVADNAVLALTPAEIRAQFSEALEAHGGYTLPPADQLPRGKGTRAALDLAFTRYVQRDDAKTAAEVGARVLLWQDGPDGAVEYEVPGAAEIVLEAETPDARRTALRKALRVAIQGAVAAMHLQLVAVGKPDDALIRDLTSRDPRVKNAAVRVLADRKNPAVTAALVERLRGDDPSIIRRTLGQLVEIRDRRAVEPIIELSRGKDPGFVRELVYALGALGGDEAEAYLDTVSTGHDQSAVRKAAEEALLELRAKREGRRPMAAQNGEGRAR